jgi:outer membrane protein OmpA-like peptidoglycan-associated protein
MPETDAGTSPEVDAGIPMSNDPTASFDPEGDSSVAEESSGRIGWGCSFFPSDASSCGLVVLLVIAFFVGFFRRKILTWIGLGIVLVGVSYQSSAYAEKSTLHLNLDLVSQMYPKDQAKDGSTSHRLGLEVGMQYSLSQFVDVGGSLSIGKYPGLRLLTTFHQDRSQRTVNLFIQPRFVIHPVPEDIGVGMGVWAGLTFEAGPGRIEVGPSIEAYTAPDNSLFRSYAFLGLLGYQFDLLGDNKVEIVKQPLVPVPPEVVPGPVEEPKVNLTETDIEINDVIQFDFDSYKLRPEAYPILDKVAKIMNDNPDILVAVIGNCCSIGSQDYNQKLSERRAFAVATYLVDKVRDGPTRLYLGGNGEDRPLVPNSTKSNRVKNRRVEFIIGTKE